MTHQALPTFHTTMVMVQNDQGEVLVLNRQKSWPGLTFPGGHLEANESIYDCARREILEETGLKIDHLKLTCLLNWERRDASQRFLVYCFTAKALKGPLKASEEGQLQWLKLEDIKKEDCSPAFFEQIPLFTDETILEAYGRYGDGADSTLTFDGGRHE